MRALLRCGVVTPVLVAVPGHDAGATDCGGYISETMTLELENVTEDGVLVDDHSAYEPFSVKLEGWPYSGPGFRLMALTGERDTWMEHYR